MNVVSNLVYLLVVLGAGFLARHLGLLNETRANYLTQFAFYVALPSLVFTSTATQPLREVLEPRLVVGLWAVLLTGAAVAWVVHRKVSTPAVRSVAVVQSYHCNFGFLGLPITAAVFPGVVTAKASIILGVGALTQIPLTVAILGAVNDTDADPTEELRGFLTNPVIAALVVGLGFAAMNFVVPGVVSTGLNALAELALPVALLAVGASLSVDRGRVPFPTVGLVVLLKMLVMPAVALVVFSLLAADLSTTRAGVLMLAMPTAVSTFIYATELGGDGSLASVNVFATTLTSVATIILVLRFVG